jgi:probable HAF family extracellular repeat protein
VQSGAFTTIDPPGAKTAIAPGINNSGTIVGTDTDANNKSHGFKYANGTFTTIDYPNAGYTTADGIDGQGEMVGTYRIGDGEFQGYLAK